MGFAEKGREDEHRDGIDWSRQLSRSWSRLNKVSQVGKVTREDFESAG